MSKLTSYVWNHFPLTRHLILWRPGHYYSPIPSLRQIRARHAEIFRPAPDDLSGVDLNTAAQLALLERLGRHHAEIPFPDDPDPAFRYHFRNAFYTHGDGVALFCMMREFRPRRIIEVGSGFSSSLMLDTNERFFDNAIDCAFIEPYPDRLLSLLRAGEKERIRLHREGVQTVNKEIFRRLEANDILFIDSSHVSKTGSDVNHLLFEILPSLRPGVLVHVHDIFYPFEYPEEWVYRGYAWNEAYCLRAFLTFNARFEILFFTSYLARKHGDRLAAILPKAKNVGSSIWLRKLE